MGDLVFQHPAKLLGGKFVDRSRWQADGMSEHTEDRRNGQAIYFLQCGPTRAASRIAGSQYLVDGRLVRRLRAAVQPDRKSKVLNGRTNQQSQGADQLGAE